MSKKASKAGVKKVSKKVSKKGVKKASKKVSKKGVKKVSKKGTGKRSVKKEHKPMSPQCKKMLKKRIRFNIKAFNEGVVFKSGHRYNKKSDAISSAFNQLRKKNPECFDN